MTMVRLLVLLLALTAALQAQAEVYRWKDAQGNVFFSDTPHAGAEIIKLGPTTIIPGQAEPKDQAEPETPASVTEVSDYESITVIAPGEEETLRDQQTVAVEVLVVPELQVGFGHQVQLYVDGEPFGEPSTFTNFAVPSTQRGSHQLAAAVLDQVGAELIRSSTTVFHLQKISVADKKTGKPRAPNLPIPPKAK